MSMLGAVNDTKNATEKSQRICDQVKAKVEDKTNKKYKEFRAVKYKDQFVAGTNFFIKVQTGEDGHLRLRVFQGLRCGELELINVQVDKGKEEPIVYF